MLAMYLITNNFFKLLKYYSRLNDFRTKSKTMAISVIMQNPFVQLKKIANHPYLVHMPLIPGKQQILVDENIIKVSGKLQVLDAMLTKLKLLGHKVMQINKSNKIT